MSRVQRKPRREIEVSVGPLNDILFILLLFFLIVSTLANPNVIKLSPPKSESDAKAKQSVVVSIDANNQIFIGTTPSSIDQLKEQLRNYKIQDSTTVFSVVINADKSVSVDKVVEVMRIAKQLGAATALSVQQP